MQGEPAQFLAESQCAARSWKDFSLSKEQGDAGGIAGNSRVAKGHDTRIARSNTYTNHIISYCIPRSRHDPKMLWVDDAKIVGDRITEVRPIPGNFFTQETERRIGELGARRIAFVVGDVSVHEAP
jgi:hypothetical protein